MSGRFWPALARHEGGSRTSGGLFVQNTGIILHQNTIEVGVSVGSSFRSAGIQTTLGDRTGLTITDNTILADIASPTTTTSSEWFSS